MPSSINIDGLIKLSTKFQSLAAGFNGTNIRDLNATPLMFTWRKIMAEDNREGILQGLDKDGVPLTAITYRPKPPGPLKPNEKQRGGKPLRAREGAFQGGAAGNLSSMEYRLLGGPPLAPRGQFSRVITNFKTTHTDPSAGAKQWQVIGFWDDVVSKKDVHFLPYHFKGTAKLPKRDIRGVRPNSMIKVRDSLRNWIRLEIREHFS